jgi:Arc/MetJ-type ribon-helix-helix transcriptional regulator
MRNRERVISVRLDRDLSDGVNLLREQIGTPVAEQIRRSLRKWLEKRGVVEPRRTAGVQEHTDSPEPTSNVNCRPICRQV